MALDLGSPIVLRPIRAVEHLRDMVDRETMVFNLPGQFSIPFGWGIVRGSIVVEVKIVVGGVGIVTEEFDLRNVVYLRVLAGGWARGRRENTRWRHRFAIFFFHDLVVCPETLEDAIKEVVHRTVEE